MRQNSPNSREGEFDYFKRAQELQIEAVRLMHETDCLSNLFSFDFDKHFELCCDVSDQLSEYLFYVVNSYSEDIWRKVLEEINSDAFKITIDAIHFLEEK